MGRRHSRKLIYGKTLQLPVLSLSDQRRNIPVGNLQRLHRPTRDLCWLTVILKQRRYRPGTNDTSN